VIVAAIIKSSRFFLVIRTRAHKRFPADLLEDDGCGQESGLGGAQGVPFPARFEMCWWCLVVGGRLAAWSRG
jgi:hypothetical protein